MPLQTELTADKAADSGKACQLTSDKARKTIEENDRRKKKGSGGGRTTVEGREKRRECDSARFCVAHRQGLRRLAIHSPVVAGASAA